MTDASEAAMKSTVALHLGGSLCTGTLIGPNQILSAAHCIHEGSQIQIGYGLTGRVVSGLKVILARHHPRWTQGPNDVSIIIFEGTLPANMVPVRISPMTGIPDGSDVLLAGYGVTSENSQDPGTLRQVNARIRQFDGDNKEFAMQEGLGVGSCYGDSGGPAYISKGGALSVIGATSRGSNCDSGDGIYEDVRQFQGWYKCVAKEAGKPLRYLANDSSNDACNAGTIDTDVDDGSSSATGRNIFVAMGAASPAASTQYPLFFASPLPGAENSRFEYCQGSRLACAKNGSAWLASQAVSLATPVFKTQATVAISNGMALSVRLTKQDGTQVIEEVQFRAK